VRPRHREAADPGEDLKKGLTRDQHFGPGVIPSVEVDTQHPIGYGVAPNTNGFYVNSPFFSIVEGFASQKPTIVARYPNTNVIASGWLKGEDLMAGRAAVVSDRDEPGTRRSVRTPASASRPDPRNVPAAFNALFLSAHDGSAPVKPSN
jgi:hypothetical protein